MNDQDKLGELARGLSTVDVDPARAKEIAFVARRDVGQGPPKGRLVLPILVGLFSTSTLVWTVYKVYEALR